MTSTVDICRSSWKSRVFHDIVYRNGGQARGVAPVTKLGLQLAHLTLFMNWEVIQTIIALIVDMRKDTDKWLININVTGLDASIHYD